MAAWEDLKAREDLDEVVVDIIRRQARREVAEDRQQDMSRKICSDICPKLKEIFEGE